MENHVVSEHLLTLLDNCDVRAAVFTTYTLDPEFFDELVIRLPVRDETAKFGSLCEEKRSLSS